MTLKHVSGGVTCSSDKVTKWGCKDSGFMIYMSKNWDNLMFPDFEQEGEFAAVKMNNNERTYSVGGKEDGD